MDSTMDSGCAMMTVVYASTPFPNNETIKAELSSSDEDTTLRHAPVQPPKRIAKPLKPVDFRIKKISPIKRSSSFKHPKALPVNTIKPQNPSPTNTDTSNEQTAQIAVKEGKETQPRPALSRASSLRGRPCTPFATTREKSIGSNEIKPIPPFVGTKEKPIGSNEAKPKNDRLNTLRSESQNDLPTPPKTLTRRKEPAIVKAILQKISVFPSTIAAQKSSNESIVLTSISWTQQLNKLVEDYTRSVDPIVYEQCNERLTQFCWAASRAAVILEQIQADFQFGSLEPEMNNTLKNFSSLANDAITGMKMGRKDGDKGNCNLSPGSIPYIADIFKQELQKQNAYGEKIAKWKPLGKDDIIRRTKLVKWVFFMSQTFGLTPDTVHFTVQIIDLYLGTGLPIRGSKGWSLLGLVALRLAGKMEESDTAPHTSQLIKHTNHFLQNAEIRETEETILAAIKYDLSSSLSPLFVNIVAIFGTSCFPNDNIKKLVIDLASGMLYKSLLYHTLSTVKAADKAQAALEIAVEFVFFQYKLFCRRDLSNYSLVNNFPGGEFGDFALEMCIENLKQRFVVNQSRSTVDADNKILFNNCRNVKHDF